MVVQSALPGNLGLSIVCVSSYGRMVVIPVRPIVICTRQIVGIEFPDGAALCTLFMGDNLGKTLRSAGRWRGGGPNQESK